MDRAETAVALMAFGKNARRPILAPIELRMTMTAPANGCTIINAPIAAGILARLRLGMALATLAVVSIASATMAS